MDSKFYIFMEENGIAKKGLNKKHSINLYQISYYIAVNYDYIPFAGDSYPENILDMSTFKNVN